MSKIDLDDVFTLGPAMKRGALHVAPVVGPKFDDRGLFLGTWSPAEPLPFVRYSGSPRDMVSTTYAVPVLISDRMVEVLQGFSGWQTYPCIIVRNTGERINDYQGLQILGRCGPVDAERGRQLWGHITPATEPGLPPPHRWFTWFDPETWDGSDLFAPQGTAVRLITRRVAEALRKAKLTNLRIVPLRET
jgi:hypothetical protein